MQKKHFTNSNTPFMMKTLIKPRIKENFLNLIKNSHKKTIANSILNGEKLGGFFPRSETGKECPLLPPLFIIVLEFLANAIS